MVTHGAIRPANWRCLDRISPVSTTPVLEGVRYRSPRLTGNLPSWVVLAAERVHLDCAHRTRTSLPTLFLSELRFRAFCLPVQHYIPEAADNCAAKPIRNGLLS